LVIELLFRDRLGMWVHLSLTTWSLVDPGSGLELIGGSLVTVAGGNMKGEGLAFDTIGCPLLLM
jgi:hypothetical protein